MLNINKIFVLILVVLLVYGCTDNASTENIPRKDNQANIKNQINYFEKLNIDTSHTSNLINVIPQDQPHIKGIFKFYVKDKSLPYNYVIYLVQDGNYIPGDACLISDDSTGYCNNKEYLKNKQFHSGKTAILIYSGKGNKAVWELTLEDLIDYHVVDLVLE